MPFGAISDDWYSALTQYTDMPNNKPAGEPCYNTDVNTSFFKLYSQQEGREPRFEGLTTSWAAIVYKATMNPKGTDSIRFGVSAVSLDQKSESEIAWSNYLNAGSYKYDDNIALSRKVIKPGEAFEMSYVDPKHEDGTRELYNAAGEKVFSAVGRTVTVEEAKTIIKLTGVWR